MLTRARLERLRRNWSLQTCGYHAGIQAPELSRIETKRAIPYPSQAERLAGVLGLRPEELQETVPASEESTR